MNAETITTATASKEFLYVTAPSNDTPGRTTCAKCGRHEGSLYWVGEGGSLAYGHGFYQRWCECCALKEQIKHAKKRARAIPKMQRELKKLECRSTPGDRV